MIALDELVVALLDTVPHESGGADDGVRIEIDEVAMTLPVEVRFGARGGLEASAPRGRYATGFDPPHQVLSVAFTTRGGQ
ncbi:MAG TPA: hypothetical protein VM261_16120 [Kofleriaceae bacterium]|nr:hypothetical protein [Kofleriaceae bacterium]